MRRPTPTENSIDRFFRPVTERDSRSNLWRHPKGTIDESDTKMVSRRESIVPLAWVASYKNNSCGFRFGQELSRHRTVNGWTAES